MTFFHKKYKQGRYTCAIYRQTGDWRKEVLVLKCFSQKHAISLISILESPDPENTLKALEMCWKYDSKRGRKSDFSLDTVKWLLHGHQCPWWPQVELEFLNKLQVGSEQ